MLKAREQLLAFLILGAVLVSLLISFSLGKNEYRLVCQKSKVTEHPQKFVAFQGCEVRLGYYYLSNPLPFLYISQLLIFWPIFSSVQNKKYKQKVYLMSVWVLVGLIMLARLLTTIFPGVHYDGWQDAEWVIRTTPLNSELFTTILYFFMGALGLKIVARY